MREENFLGLRADLQVGGRGFGKFSEASTIFSTIFWKISTIFLEFSAIFLENFPKNFCNFFRLLRFFYDFSRKFFRKFFRKFSLTIRYGSTGDSTEVQPRFRHYCKFTSKFTSKFTPILIKILQSTKFEGSHFFNSLFTFTASYDTLSTFQSFSPLCAPFPSPPRFPNHSSAVPKVPTAVPPLAMAEVCGQYEGL